MTNCYDRNEMKKLFEHVVGTPIEIPVRLAGLYGLRQGEMLGLRWEDVDFEENTITIRRTIPVHTSSVPPYQVKSKATTTKAGLRKLPLISAIRGLLLALHERQKTNCQLYGDSYCVSYQDFICVHENGKFMKHEYLSVFFKSC